jgi:hypothetical protein
LYLVPQPAQKAPATILKEKLNQGIARNEGKNYNFPNFCYSLHCLRNNYVFEVKMNFWDHLGRLHTKPVTETDRYPTNNAYWYTAIYKVLQKGLIKLQPELPQTMPFSRHPDEIAPPISHDELYGVSILSQRKALQIVMHLEHNHNQFCDLTDFRAKSFWSLIWFKTALAFYKLSKEENPRRAVIRYPDVWNVAFWQRPEHRWFYKRAAGITPTLFERIYFTAARTISILKWKVEEPNLLLFFSLQHLKQSNLDMGVEGRLMNKWVKRKLFDLYNNDVGTMLLKATKDLPAEYYWEHPWNVNLK